MTSAKVILDSVSPIGYRLTTMEVTFHRFVLAEFNTHRRFSRNSASSRAIPVEKQLLRVKNDPALPVKWPREQRGMQGGDLLKGEDLDDAQDMFNDVYWYTCDRVQDYVLSHPDKETRLHKSLVNRLLEPFMWHTVIVTATHWEEFFDQRCSELAQPEIAGVADLMRDALYSSTPRVVDVGEWHTPYIEDQDLYAIDRAWEHNTLPCSKLEARKRISTARCARVSYLTHDGVRDIHKDLGLYEKLVTADPPHWSPLEHVATPANSETPGNFYNWLQLRHIVEDLREQGVR